MTELESYKAKLCGHDHLQYRLRFRNSLKFVTVWAPTGDEENPYRFITGGVFNHRNHFIRLMPEPGG